MTSILFAAAVTARYQSPPFERPSGHAVLLLRQPSATEGGRDTWRFPDVGELESQGDVEAWTGDGDTVLARVDGEFTPPDVAISNLQWIEVAFAASCLPSVYAPGVLPALQRFVRDQRLDDILARADAATHSHSHSQGDDDMSAEVESLKRQLAALERRVGPPIGDAQEFRAAQVRADGIYRLFADAGAPTPVAGERILEYRARLLAGVQHLTPKFKGSNFALIADSTALTAVEDVVYADAASEVMHPSAGFLPGQMRALKTQDQTGRTITRYIGDPNACWDQFRPPIRYVRRILTAAR